MSSTGYRASDLAVGEVRCASSLCGVGCGQYLSNMENGFAVPSLTTVLRLAVALGCKVTALTSVFDKVDLPSILPK